MAKTRMSKKFDKCVKSVRKTVRARKGSNKESAAIAICTKSVLQTRGRTIKRYRKGRLQTQRRFRGGGMFDKLKTGAKNLGSMVSSLTKSNEVLLADLVNFIRETTKSEVGFTTEKGKAAADKINAFMNSPTYNPQKPVQFDFTADTGSSFSPAGWKYCMDKIEAQIAKQPDAGASAALENLKRSNGKIDMPLQDLLSLGLFLENEVERYIAYSLKKGEQDIFRSDDFITMRLFNDRTA
jgi:hypothetical protein